MVTLWQVDLPHFCAGVLTRSYQAVGKYFEREVTLVVEEAPILAWAHGKEWGKIRRWVMEKGGSVTLVSQEED